MTVDEMLAFAQYLADKDTPKGVNGAPRKWVSDYERQKFWNRKKLRWWKELFFCRNRTRSRHFIVETTNNIGAEDIFECLKEKSIASNVTLINHVRVYDSRIVMEISKKWMMKTML